MIVGLPGALTWFGCCRCGLGGRPERSLDARFTGNGVTRSGRSHLRGHFQHVPVWVERVLDGPCRLARGGALGVGSLGAVWARSGQRDPRHANPEQHAGKSDTHRSRCRKNFAQSPDNPTKSCRAVARQSVAGTMLVLSVCAEHFHRPHSQCSFIERNTAGFKTCYTSQESRGAVSVSMQKTGFASIQETILSGPDLTCPRLPGLIDFQHRVPSVEDLVLVALMVLLHPQFSLHILPESPFQVKDCFANLCAAVSRPWLCGRVL